MVDTIPIIERRVRYGPAVGRRRRRRALAQHRQPLLSKTGGQGEPGSILAIADHREPREELQCWSGRYRSAVQCTCGLNPLHYSLPPCLPCARCVCAAVRVQPKIMGTIMGTVANKKGRSFLTDPR